MLVTGAGASLGAGEGAAAGVAVEEPTGGGVGAGAGPHAAAATVSAVSIRPVMEREGSGGSRGPPTFRGRPAALGSDAMDYERGRFCWVDLSAHDLDGAIEWYEKYFGWKAREEDTEGGPRYVTFFLGDAKVAGAGQMPEPQQAQMPPVWSSYIKVDDCAADEAAAKELGAETILPTMQVMQHGSMCVIRDPTGAAVGFWQPGAHHGADLCNQPGSFTWNELATRDMADAKRFYGELFGWTTKPIPGDNPAEVIHLGDRENGHMLFMNEAWKGMPPMWTVYFAVDDCDAMAARADELGGKVMVPPFDIAPGRIAVVADGQGAHFYIIALKNPS